jgi:integration host factor subunit beta
LEESVTEEIHMDDDAKQPVMTKAGLVEEVARTVQVTKKQAETIVNLVLDSIVDSLRQGEKIELRGFGSFRIRNRKSRLGRNPKTGEKVEVPPKRIPYFKPGKELKELINPDEPADATEP